MVPSPAMRKVANQCYHKILSGADYGAHANIYSPSSIADMELSTPQCLLLALLHSLVTGDVMSCILLADICQQVDRLRSRHLRVWLLEDFSFPRTDIVDAMALLLQLVADGTLKLPAYVLAIMSALAKQHRIPGVQFRALLEDSHCDLATLLENAVANKSPRDIFELVSEGADVCGSTQSGDSFLHIAARAGCSDTIKALVFLNADLEAVNSSNATPLEEAVRHNSSSSVRALLIAGAKYDRRLAGGDTYLHAAAAGGYNEAMEALLERGTDLDKKNQLEETPLFQAIRAGNIQGIKLLKKKGADFSALSGVKLKDGDSIVHSVASSGNVEILKILKIRKVPANIKNHSGLTPLHVASNPSVVRMLLRMGVPVDSQDNVGSTALMISSRNIEAEIVTLLLLNRADPKIKNKEGRTALHYAAEEGCVGSVTSQMDIGARLCEEDNKDDTNVFVAAVNNNPEVVRVLIDNRATVDMKGKYLQMALHKAAAYRHTAVATALLDAGAAVDMKDQREQTPLHWAACNRHTAVVTALLDAGAAVDMKNSGQNTSLHLAAERGHTAVVTALLDAGAAVDMKNRYQQTALHLAAEKGHTAVVTALLDAGAVVDMKDQYQQTALHLAASRFNSAVVKALLDARAAVDMKDQREKTALYRAAGLGHTAVATALLDAGADPAARADGGLTPLIEASLQGKLAMVELLIGCGVDINATADNGWTALHIANHNDHRAVADYLRSRGGIE